MLPTRFRQALLHRRFDPATSLVSLRDLAVSRQVVFRAEQVRLHDIRANPQARASWEPSYPAQDATVGEVSIVRLPRDTRVSGVWGFAVLCDGFMVAEQQVAVSPDMLPHIAYGLRTREVTVRVPGDAMLIARFGEGTWGHWLGELLPKIAVCERKAPGRFSYVMAGYVLDDALLGRRVRESCAAYGVSEDRFISIPNGEQYGFDRLYAMTPVFSGGTLHSRVRRALHEGLASPRGRPQGAARVNLHRNDGRRSLTNSDEVDAELHRRGFASVDIGGLTFLEQVATFQDATHLFSVLGSGLSGLVYSPPPTRVAAAAPDGWGDDFFYGLLRTSAAARWAEARGPIVDRHTEHLRLSSFRVDPKVLAAALDSLDL